MLSLTYREDQSQNGEAEGTDETHKWANCRNSHGQNNGSGHQDCAQHIVDQCRALLALLLNAIPDDLQAHKELQSKCAIYGQGNEHLHRLGGPLLDGQIQGDALTGGGTVTQIAKESQQHINKGHARHALAEHTADSEETLWRLHVVLQRHNHTDCLHCKDGDREELRQCAPNNGLALLHWWQILDQIVERNAQSQAHENIGHHRHGCQVLEIWHPGNKDQRHQHYANEHAQRHCRSRPIGNQLLKVRGHNNRVHRAGAKVRQEQTKQDGELGHWREATAPFWSFLEGSLGNFGKGHLGAASSVVQLVSAFYLLVV